MRLTAVLRRGSSLVLAVATGGGTAPVSSHRSIMPDNLSGNSSTENVLSAYYKCGAVPCALPYLTVSILITLHFFSVLPNVFLCSSLPT